MKLVSSISSLAVATVLFFSGLVHAVQPYYFIHTISAYRLLPISATGLLGILLPYLQIVLAICICLRIAENVALRAAALLFTVFASAQIAVLLRGIEIDCGCFGFVAHSVSLRTVMLPILLVVACAIALRYGDRFSRSLPPGEEAAVG